MTTDELAYLLYNERHIREDTIADGLRVHNQWEAESLDSKDRWRRVAMYVHEKLAECTREAIQFGVNSVFADLAIITKDGITVQRATARARERWERQHDQTEEHASEKTTQPAAPTSPVAGDAPVPAGP